MPAEVNRERLAVPDLDALLRGVLEKLDLAAGISGLYGSFKALVVRIAHLSHGGGGHLGALALGKLLGIVLGLEVDRAEVGHLNRPPGGRAVVEGGRTSLVLVHDVPGGALGAGLVHGVVGSDGRLRGELVEVARLERYGRAVGGVGSDDITIADDGKGNGPLRNGDATARGINGGPLVVLGIRGRIATAANHNRRVAVVVDAIFVVRAYIEVLKPQCRVVTPHANGNATALLMDDCAVLDGDRRLVISIIRDVNRRISICFRRARKRIAI